eukprot:1323367-Prorocentrum_lima.AAC.1
MWQRRDLQQLYAEVTTSIGRQTVRASMGVQTPKQRLQKRAQAITHMVKAGSTSRANSLLLRSTAPYSDPHDRDRIAQCFSSTITATPPPPAKIDLTEQQQEELVDILRAT